MPSNLPSADLKAVCCARMAVAPLNHCCSACSTGNQCFTNCREALKSGYAALQHPHHAISADSFRSSPTQQLDRGQLYSAVLSAVTCPLMVTRKTYVRSACGVMQRPLKRARLSVSSGPQHAASQPNLLALSAASPAAPAPDAAATNGSTAGAAPPADATRQWPLRSDAAADALRAALQGPVHSTVAALPNPSAPAAAVAGASPAAAQPAASLLLNGHAVAASNSPAGAVPSATAATPAASPVADADEDMPDAPASPPHAGAESQQRQRDSTGSAPHHIAGVSPAAWALLQRQSPQPAEPPAGLRGGPVAARRSSSPAAGRRDAEAAAEPQQTLTAAAAAGPGSSSLRSACELLAHDRARSGSPAARRPPLSVGTSPLAGGGRDPAGWQRRPQLWHPQRPDQPGSDNSTVQMHLPGTCNTLAC